MVTSKLIITMKILCVIIPYNDTNWTVGNLNSIFVSEKFFSVLMQRVLYILNLVFLLIFMYSCNKVQDKILFDQLSRWDSQIDRSPYAISDSLKLIDYSELNRSNKAYYNLLKVISDDKTYYNFTSDSLINSVALYYKGHDPKNSNYIRALAYQGIVRTRMGVRDSTVYEPLREANRLLGSMSNPNPTLGYFINFFLGNVHYNNRNFVSANEYFQTTLKYAQLEKDSTHLLDTYLALYWNEMQNKDFGVGKIYLDTVSMFYDVIPDKNYFILNAQSIYLDIIGEPEKAVEKVKDQLKIYNKQRESIEVSRLYFNISDRYVGLGQLDSAMYYAKTAVAMIEDSTFRQNHLYYKNIADIAEKKGDYIVANEYRKQASEFYKNSVQDRLNTQIAEIEKKYDLTESENKVLKAQRQIMRIIITALMVFIVFIFILMYAYKIRRNTKLKLLVTENRLHQQELQTVIMREEAGKRKWLLQLYSNISDRLTFLQEEFEKLTQRYVSSQPKVYKEMQRILKNTDTDLRDIGITLAPDDDTFFSYTKIKDENNILSPNDKLILMLLSCEANNRQLATFMNTTIDSIRVRKSQLKKKMSENNYDVSLFG